MEKPIKGHNNLMLGTEEINKLMWKFSIPAIISGLVGAGYNIIDQIFIGHGIGELGMAATNIAFPLVTISTAFALLFGVGGASNFNLNMGRGEPDIASKSVGNAISWMVLSGIAVSIIAIIFLRPLLFLFGATEPIMPYAEPYTLITNIGIPFLIFSTGAASIIRADGRPGYSMLVMISGAVFNVTFNAIFLFVLNMGIEGIALSTILGQILSSVVALHYLLRRFKTVTLKKVHFQIDFHTTKLICALGVAACFNQLAMTVVQIIKSNSLRHYGALSMYGSEIPLAAVGAVSKILVIYMAFTIGIAQGCQPIYSFNYGAQKYDRVQETYKKAILYATIISVIAFLCFQIFPKQILGIFGSDSDMFYEFAIKYMRIFMMMTFINGIQPVTANFFTAIGKAQLGFWMSLTRQIILLVPLMLILPIFFGIDGVVWAGPISDTFAVILVIIFVIREMKKMDVKKSRQKN